MDCFRKKKKLIITPYFDSISLSTIKDEEKEEEEDEDEVQDTVVDEEFSLNEEMRKRLHSPDETEETFDINECQFEGGNTVLHEVVIAGNYKVLKELLKLGPKINIQNQDGDTPLISILKECKDCFHIDREFGEELECEKESDLEEEKKACEKHFNCLEILLENNAEISIKNNAGLSALSFASMCCNKKREEYFKKLLSINQSDDFCSKLYQALEEKSDPEYLSKIVLKLKIYYQQKPRTQSAALLFG